MGRRPGFTLMELMVVCALIVILSLMAFGSFRFLSATMNQAVSKTRVRENLSLVMDQLTKELREVTSVNDFIGTNDGSRANYGVTLPVWTGTLTADATRGIPAGTWNLNTSVLTATSNAPGALTSGQSYTFNTSVGNLSPNGNGIILEFFTIDTDSKKHRIRYSLAAPKDGLGAYNGIGQSFWASSQWEPCEVTYCNNTWDTGTSSWSSEAAQPMTDQLVTAFTVIRPLWSSNVIQIILEAQVRNVGGTGFTTVRLIGQVAVRQ